MTAAPPAFADYSITATIAELRSRWFSTAQIADKLGIRPQAVLAIEAGTGGKPPRQGSGSTARQHTVCVDNDVLLVLRPHADRRGVSVNALIRQLLALLVDDDLVDALLDDDDDVVATGAAR